MIKWFAQNNGYFLSNEKQVVVRLFFNDNIVKSTIQIQFFFNSNSEPKTALNKKNNDKKRSDERKTANNSKQH